jgi:hypothetical protein
MMVWYSWGTFLVYVLLFEIGIGSLGRGGVGMGFYVYD